MPWSLRRFQQSGQLHFVTSAVTARPLLSEPSSRTLFEKILERMRRKYGFFVCGYVVMPEHVHILLSEPARETLATVLQTIKQAVSRRLGSPDGQPFWEARYYDFNVFSDGKRIEKLRYLHRNPVERGLVQHPEDWPWSSFRHHLSGEEGNIEIESLWTAKRREQEGETPSLKG